MNEGPILFSGPMVRAILDGRKTQTRRIMKPQPTSSDIIKSWSWFGKKYCGGWCGDVPDEVIAECPYGQPGDRLWVREKMKVSYWVPDSQEIGISYVSNGSRWSGKYPDRLKWEPIVGQCLPYGGFREASRITLEITEVRVQRIQDISYEDIQDEGAFIPPTGTPDREYGVLAYDAFQKLWDSINDKRGFGCEKNPWVWAITFRRIS